MRISKISWLALAVSAALMLSACGSSSSAPPGGTTASTRSPAESAALAHYLEQGDQVCRRGYATVAPVDAHGVAIVHRHRGTPAEAALLVPLLREAVRDYRHFYERLARIPPPPQDTASVTTILAGLRRVGRDLERETAALARGETAKIRAIQAEREVDHARVSALELEFGFKVCGQPQPEPPIPG